MGRDRSKFSRLKVFSYLVLTTLSFLLLAPRYAHGQVDEGAITGTVLDSTGAVVPNAQVTLFNTDQGITSETHSSASGAVPPSPRTPPPPTHPAPTPPSAHTPPDTP